MAREELMPLAVDALVGVGIPSFYAGNLLGSLTTGRMASMRTLCDRLRDRIAVLEASAPDGVPNMVASLNPEEVHDVYTDGVRILRQIGGFTVTFRARPGQVVVVRSYAP